MNEHAASSWIDTNLVRALLRCQPLLDAVHQLLMSLRVLHAYAQSTRSLAGNAGVRTWHLARAPAR
jgi:hypothetical protein